MLYKTVKINVNCTANESRWPFFVYHTAGAAASLVFYVGVYCIHIRYTLRRRGKELKEKNAAIDVVRTKTVLEPQNNEHAISFFDCFFFPPFLFV